ncbi:E3 ubiquitin- ligase DTX3L [Paramuricea clavata]|uniref:E3 ubiquitin- ligase DTX3L n=1 Tax=Paramuricea clavata TaxID=317549 RepID=A0A6S7GVE0_PARCT|nr:E3 ubiquitin- ligase DTX3L [Paramuricea clavata]
MPRNHFICNMVKATAVLDRGIGVPCSHNCSQSYSVARCVTCEKFLCRECLTDHNKYRANDGHSVLTMEELSKPENRKKIKDKMYCNEHSGMDLKVYCETCDQLICRDCMDFKHVKQGHSCVLVKDVASNYKELLASNNKAMEDALTESNTFLKRLTLMTAQLDRDAENIKTKIAQRREFVAKKVIEMLDQKAESLCKKVDEIHKGKRANLDRQAQLRNKVKMMLDNANSLLKKREKYFKAPIPVANLSYTTACAGKEPINEQILTRLANGLGDVNAGKKDTAVGDTLKIGEAELNVEQRNSQTEDQSCDQSSVQLRATDQSARVLTRPSDQSAQSKEPDESFSISSLFIRFIIAYHYEEYQKLENVSQEISFEVSESKTDRNLKFFARQDVNGDIFSKTVDEFIRFYQNQNQKMHQEVIPMLPKKRNDVILEARAKFSVVIDSAQDPDKITIYGEKDNVQGALKFLRNKVGDLTTSTPSNSSEFKGGRSSKGATGSSSSKGAAAGSPNPTSTTGEKILIEKLSCVLFQDIKVFVYQGNITKETVDVIVNPANEHLNHSAGAAEAIVKAGGKSIQDESDAIMRKRRYVLNPGEVVLTKAGNLRCNFIIHVVGPRWAHYQYYEKDTAKNVLFSAVINCLTNASHYDAKSISIPAIGSGIFGVPVQICAEILFIAAINFVKNAAKSNSLKEIRFVNIDKPTSQVFAQEMKKRFGASIHRENVELFHSNNVGGNEKATQHGQSQSNDWKQNPIATNKPTKPVDPKPAKATLAVSHSSRIDNKGSQGGKSNLNPNASAFSTSRSHSSSAPNSYSNAVTGNTGKGLLCLYN